LLLISFDFSFGAGRFRPSADLLKALDGSTISKHLQPYALIHRNVYANIGRIEKTHFQELLDRSATTGPRLAVAFVQRLQTRHTRSHRSRQPSPPVAVFRAQFKWIANLSGATIKGSDSTNPDLPEAPAKKLRVSGKFFISMYQQPRNGHCIAFIRKLF
jgi:hypothetical protein